MTLLAVVKLKFTRLCHWKDEGVTLMRPSINIVENGNILDKAIILMREKIKFGCKISFVVVDPN